MTLLLALACSPEPSTEACASCDGACRYDVQPATSREHDTAEIDYEDPPPTSGAHDPCWAAWGVHTEEVADDNWVHNLEHGGVVFLYACPDGCDADVASLTAWVQSLNAGRALLTPYAGLGEWRFAAVAWEHRLLTGCLDLDAFGAFFADHVAQAPEVSTSDPGEACM